MWLRGRAKPETLSNLPPVPVAKIFSALCQAGFSPGNLAVTCKTLHTSWDKFICTLSGSRNGVYVLQWLKKRCPRTAAAVLLQLGVQDPMVFLKRLGGLAEDEEQLCR